MNTKIAILDYGIGNVRSIHNALSFCGVDPVLTDQVGATKNCSGLIIPGVGAFQHGMHRLMEKDLVDVIHKTASEGKMVLGICLGMQMLGSSSEEFGHSKGLNMINAMTKPLEFEKGHGCRLPNVGWRKLSCKTNHESAAFRLLSKTKATDFFYFVHSFHAEPEAERDILATSQYCGTEFCAAMGSENVMGVQFHPEKSGKAGLGVLKNYVDLCERS